MRVRLGKFNWFEKRHIKKMGRDPKEFPMACIHRCFNLFGRRWVVQDDWFINKEYGSWELVPFSWYPVMVAHEWMHDFLYHEFDGETSIKLDNISIGLDLNAEDLIDDAWEELGKC